MIKEKTVFILGAGASCPYGFPSGQELREEICSKYVSDKKKYLASLGGIPNREIEIRISPVTKFAETFYKSSTKSIDLFLARNPEFKEDGKLSIIFRILAAEQSSLFREHTKNREQDWYSYLFQRLTDDLVKKEDCKRLRENNVSFITFNYDRSLEHFLYESLIHSFNGVDKAIVLEQLNNIRIIHVFGQIAQLDWQSAQRWVEYKTNNRLIPVEQLIDNLRIIYEQNENPEIEESRTLISNARRIFFLGFGYAKENLEVLKILETVNKTQEIYGTALKFKQKEIQSVRNDFPQSFGPHTPDIHIADMDCLTLLREYL
jgi:hypothetical protein